MKVVKKIMGATILAILLAPVAALAQYGSGGYGSDYYSSSASGGGWKGGLAAAQQFGLPNPFDGIYGIIYNLLMWLLAIFGIVGVIGFVISGLMYLTAAGDSGKMETAKSAMLYSIIGVIVGLAGLVVVVAATNLLNANSF